MRFSLEPHGGLPESSPARRSQVDISWQYRRNPHPLYVILMQGYIVLATSEVALAVLAPGDVGLLHAVLRDAQAHSRPPRPGGQSQPPTESRSTPMLLEERALLTDLKSLAKKAPDFIADFKSGELSITDQHA